MTLQEIHDKLAYLKQHREVLENQRKSTEVSFENAEKEYAVSLETQRLIREASQLTLSNLSVRIGTIVTKALTQVLGEGYKFNLDFDIKYNKLAADMYLEKDGKRYDLKRDNGDGVVDIVALALRVAILCLDRRKLRRLLILDEPCGAVSVNYQPVLGKMIKQLSTMLDLQVIMVASHGSNMQIPDAKVFDSNEFTEGARL
jgi:predicted ATPase